MNVAQTQMKVITGPIPSDAKQASEPWMLCHSGSTYNRCRWLKPRRSAYSPASQSV